jgi:hypothetical protein
MKTRECTGTEKDVKYSSVKVIIQPQRGLFFPEKYFRRESLKSHSD